jgi:hypothetical protein
MGSIKTSIVMSGILFALSSFNTYATTSNTGSGQGISPVARALHQATMRTSDLQGTCAARWRK